MAFAFGEESRHPARHWPKRPRPGLSSSSLRATAKIAGDPVLRQALPTRLERVPERFLAPISVVNFDKRITRARVAAVVHEAFKLSAFVPRPTQDAALFGFVNDYQRRFVDYVQAAVDLAASANRK